MSAPHSQVVQLHFPIANAYLVKGERAMLVDTGTPGCAQRILDKLAREAVRPRDVSLILLTHGHLDHFGSALELRQLTGAPIAIHALDADALRAGHNPTLVPRGTLARLMKPLFQHRRVTPFEPDLLLDEATRLADFGVTGRIVTTPGHTPGSVSVLLPSGDLIAGDLLIGGYVGGLLRPRLPAYPYFYDEQQQIRSSVRKILDLPVEMGPVETGPVETVHVGHGGPLSASAIRRWLEETSGQQPG